MSSSDPFTVGLGPSSSSPDAEGVLDQSAVARANRLAQVLRGEAPAAGHSVDPDEAGPGDSEPHREIPGGPSAESVELPQGAVGGAGGRPFSDFSVAESKAAHLSAQTGDPWWVRALSSHQFVLVCGAFVPAAVSEGARRATNDQEETPEDFRTKSLDEVELSDFPDGHPVHRFGLGQYKRFAKRNFKFKPSYRSMWPLFVLAVIGALCYQLPVAVITLLPADAVYQLLESFSEEALVGGAEKFGLLVLAVAVGKILFTRHYRRYYLMPAFVKSEEGIIARKSTKISYTNVVNYDVGQNVIARLLNYGTLELSSAGSDGAEINMRNVFSPRVVELVLESRMEECRQALRR